MSKRKKQNKKRGGVLNTILMVLFTLVLAGAVWDAVSDHVDFDFGKDAVSYEEVSIEFTGYKVFTLDFEYAEGMTWEEAIEHNENLAEILSVNEDGVVVITMDGVNPNGSGVAYLVTYENSGASQNAVCIKASDVINLTASHSTIMNY